MNDPTNLTPATVAAWRASQDKTEPPIALPADPLDAAATLYAALTNSDEAAPSVKEAFAAMTRRNQEIISDPQAMAAMLAAQAQVLEALGQRFIVRAERLAQAGKPDAAHLAVRSAVACSRQMTACLGAVWQITRPQT